MRKRGPVRLLVIVLVVLGTLVTGVGTAFAADSQVALFDPDTGRWHFRFGVGGEAMFFYGNPGDIPLLGDWDCDGVDTVGMYRPTSGFVYLRNSNDFGTAEMEFFFGNPGDIPLVGDWNKDGCDTLAVYRNSQIFVANVLGTVVAEFSFFFGNPGDTPFTADFDGDGVTTVGVYRETTGLVYHRNTLDTGAADGQFFFGLASDQIIAGDWDDDGDETVGIFRSSLSRFFLSNENETAPADIEYDFGESDWLPVAGDTGAFGPQPSLKIAMPAVDNLRFAASFDVERNDWVAEVELGASVDSAGDTFTVTWSSDLDGSLGMGESLTAGLGTHLQDTTAHVVRATLRTSSGTLLTDKRDIIVFIASN